MPQHPPRRSPPRRSPSDDTGAGDAPGPAAIPDGWTRHAAHGLDFALPPGWTTGTRGEMFTATSPDFAPQDGNGLGLSVMAAPAEDFEKDFPRRSGLQRAAERTRRAPLALGGGVRFAQAVMMPGDSGQPVAMRIAHAPAPLADAGYLVINVAAPDPAALDRDAGLIDAILGTFRLSDPGAYKAAILDADATAATAASAAPVTTLGGLVTIRPPAGWRLKPGDDAATLRTDPGYGAYVTLRRGAAARAAIALDGLFRGTPRESAGRVLGRPAKLFTGAAAHVGMQSGTRMQRGQLRVYILRDCLPGDEPVMVETAAAPGWLADNDIADALSAISARWPDDMQPCPPPIAARARFAIDGLFAYVLPEGFETGASRSSFWIRTTAAPYANLGVATGSDSFPARFRLATSNRLAGGFVAAPETRRTEVMGEPAMLFAGRGQAGAATRPRQVALLDRCLPGGDPVMVTMTADDAWLAANGGFDALTEQAWLTLPGGAQPCAPALLRTAMEAAGLIGGRAAPDPAQGAAPDPGTASDRDATGRATAPEPRPTVWRPVGAPVTGGLDSTRAVRNGPGKATAFRLESRGHLDRITTYHWNGGRGATPGTIALRDADGRLHGPWPARGETGQGGVADATWVAEPGIVLPAGKYTVIDSDPATWATNAEVGDRGMFTVALRRVVRDDAPDAADAPAGTDTTAGPAETAFWQAIAGSDDPADFRAFLRAYPDGAHAPQARARLARLAPLAGDGAAATPPAPSAMPGAYHTPARGTAERAALMDAARVPVQRALGQPVIFVVSTLRSDGNWAYLSARPVQPGGQAIDWRQTPFARDWAADMMSDLVMVVMRRDADGWRAVEHVIGPTDVAWLGWVDAHGWPRALFTER